MMLVDDHPIVRRGVRDILVEAFPTSSIEEVGSGGEAMSRIRSHRWDLIILDLELRDGQGMDLLEDLRLASAAPPVIVFSAQDTEENLGANVVSVLVKSRTPLNNLVEAVEEVLSPEKVYAS